MLKLVKFMKTVTMLVHGLRQKYFSRNVSLREYFRICST